MPSKKKELNPAEKEAKEAAKREKDLAKAAAELLKAAKNDDVKRATAAVEKGADVHAEIDDNQNTLMHTAASFGAVHIIDYLHKLGCPIDPKNKFKRTPFDGATRVGETKAVELIEAIRDGRPYKLDDAAVSDDEYAADDGADDSLTAPGGEAAPSAPGTSPPGAVITEALSAVKVA